MHVFTHASSVSSTLGLVALKNSCLVFTLWDLGFEVKLLFWARVGLGLVRVRYIRVSVIWYVLYRDVGFLTHRLYFPSLRDEK